MFFPCGFKLPTDIRLSCVISHGDDNVRRSRQMMAPNSPPYVMANMAAARALTQGSKRDLRPPVKFLGMRVRSFKVEDGFRTQVYTSTGYHVHGRYAFQTWIFSYYKLMNKNNIFTLFPPFYMPTLYLQIKACIKLLKSLHNYVPAFGILLYQWV